MRLQHRFGDGLHIIDAAGGDYVHVGGVECGQEAVFVGGVGAAPCTRPALLSGSTASGIFSSVLHAVSMTVARKTDTCFGKHG